MWNELTHRIFELLSLFSCLLNVVVGTGDREVTLSAGSWELRRRGKTIGHIYVFLIDNFWKIFNQKCHCKKSWVEHFPLIQKAIEDRIQKGLYKDIP